ncbi:MAG: SurA N-terminal domain-containing protein [Alphaproteobacteria bacterium]|nr:SurA N-terminal domain-containing protein [Alphaproteobacteria bacterium]
MRSYLDTWIVRGLFAVLVVAFGLWGIGDVVNNIGRETWVAKVGSTEIEGPQVQEAFRQQLAQVTKMLGDKEPSPELRRSIASQSLDRLIAQTLLAQEARDLHISVPNEAVREAVYQLPAFRGPNGQFDRSRLEQVLRNNGMNEQHFLELMRTDLSQRQLLEAVRAGAMPPDMLTRAVFDFEFERRAADMAELPFADAKPPAEPSEDVLKRWWENHPDAYRIPEYRRIKLVVLSPQTLAKDIKVSDEDLRAEYEARKSEYVTPPKRSAEVITAPDEAHAKQLAAAWKAGADWAKMQQEAQAAGGSAIDLTDAKQAEFPSPELGKAIFAAAPDAVSDPIHDAAGWAVVRVTKVTPGTERSFDQVKDELRDRVLAEKATDLMYDRANKVDNILGSGTSLDQLPSDLGLGAMTGTLDAEGNTPQGQPAPIPGPPELRSAIATAAFQAQKGDPPHLIEVPTPSTGGSSYYALELEDVTPAAQKPFDTVKDQVKADWTRDAIHKEQETAAAQVLSEVKGGMSFADAAAKAGLTVRRSPLTGRATPAEGVPPELVRPLFAAKKGEPLMVETPDGFVVAVPATIEQPDPKADPADYDKVRQALMRAIGDDIELTFAKALRDRTPPKINQKLLDQIAQP